MGSQLWTSPQTGYRRRGTRFFELRSLFEEGITAQAILEPLKSCPIDARASEMREHLDTRDFDVAGVQEAKDGRVIGFVRRENLTDGNVRDHLERFRTRDLVSDSIPLAGIFEVLREQNHVFVVVGPSVRGIITVADLNKPAARIYLFGLVSLLEMHLTFWISRHYEGESWTEVLSPGRLEKARSLLEERKAKKQELGLLDCLQFCDRRDIVLASSETCETLELEDPSDAKELLKNAEDIRDNLAHSQYDLVEGGSWTDVADVVAGVEALLEVSDTQVERRAEEAAEGFQDRLWASSSKKGSMN